MHKNNTFNSYEDLTGEYPVAVTFIDLTKFYENVRWHDSIEINIVNNGIVEVQISEKNIYLEAGQGIILLPNIVHSIRAVTPDKCTLYSVHFHPSFIFTYEQPFIGNKYMKAVLESPNLQTVKLEEKNTWDNIVLDTINDLIAANLTKKYGYELISKSLLCTFWALLLQKIDNSSLQKRTIKASTILDSERVKMAITFMEQHYTESISLDDIAAYVHISKSECCRCFKRSLKLSPFEYLMRYRIYVASRTIIENPNLKSISDLGFSVGFNNSSYFNKIFKHFLNCTPTEYRKKIKAASSTQNGTTAFVPYRF